MASRKEIENALRQRLLSGTYLGLIQSGARLSSVRDLATEFGVGNRVVLAAYRTLEREGLVELRPRSGIFFGSAPGGSSTTASGPLAWAIDALAAGLERGIAPRDAGSALARFVSSIRVVVACVECNDDQISGLCDELQRDFGVEVRGLNVDDLLGAPTVSADLREAHLVVTTPFHTGEVQELAQRAKLPWLTVTYRADVYSEIARLLPTQSVYFIVTDERFAKKLTKIYQARPGAENFHALVLDRDDPDAVPETSAVYVSRSARDRIAGHRLLDRVLPPQRIFSAESARELLAFIARTNADAH